MAEVAEWRALDSKEFNEPLAENVAGVQIKSYASPYDVPEAMRIRLYPDSCHLLVEFRYMGGKEPVEPEVEDDDLKLWLGRDSHRLLMIELNLKHYEPDAIKRVIDELSSKPQTPPRQSNYQVAKKVLLTFLPSFDSSKCGHPSRSTEPAE